MDVDQLRIFVDVARQGSFAGAARTLGLDPSKVTRAVAGLEAELGVRLLQRTTRQVPQRVRAVLALLRKQLGR